MHRWIGAGVVLSLVVSANGVPAWGQIVERERDVKVTGPRGRSVERSVVTERGPGFVERQVNIQRPGGTYHSEVLARRPVGPAPAFRGGFGPAWGWGRPPVVVSNPGLPVGEALAIGGGMFGLGMLANSAMNRPAPPPPPPTYVLPGYPAQAVPPGTVVYAQPPQQVQPAVVFDPFQDAMGRLQSTHDNSRRDGALALGQLRDPRAVPALANLLKNDWSREVRAASATAIGEIGDPRGVKPLERAIENDNRQTVREAAAAALSSFPREVQMNPAAAIAASAAAPPQQNVATTAAPETIQAGGGQYYNGPQTYNGPQSNQVAVPPPPTPVQSSGTPSRP